MSELQDIPLTRQWFTDTCTRYYEMCYSSMRQWHFVTKDRLVIVYSSGHENSYMDKISNPITSQCELLMLIEGITYNDKTGKVIT